MASELQIAANRRNAALSTGPRSLVGKARSSQNSLRHGLTATQTMLPGEDPAEFQAIRQGMFSALRPSGILENQLLERAASLMWRMRRIQVCEVALFQWTLHLQEQYHDQPELEDAESQRNEPASPDVVSDFKDALKVGRMIEALLNSDLTSKLSRYEAAMQRQLSITLGEYHKLQKARDEVSRLVEQRVAELREAESGVDDIGVGLHARRRRPHR